MDEGTDTGDILWQKPFSIERRDDARSLYDKIKQLASEAIEEFLPQLERGDAPRIPQEEEHATHFRKRTEEDGVVDWTDPAETISNVIRGLTRPYVGAHTYLNGEKMILWVLNRRTAHNPSPPLPGQLCDPRPIPSPFRPATDG